MDLSSILPIVISIVGKAAEQYPVIVSILTVIGASRVIMKPLMALLHTVAEQTETKKDDEVLEQVEQSKIYKGFVFVTDWLLSVKLPPKK